MRSSEIGSASTSTVVAVPAGTFRRGTLGASPVCAPATAELSRQTTRTRPRACTRDRTASETGGRACDDLNRRRPRPLRSLPLSPCRLRRATSRFGPLGKRGSSPAARRPPARRSAAHRLPPAAPPAAEPPSGHAGDHVVLLVLGALAGARTARARRRGAPCGTHIPNSRISSVHATAVVPRQITASRHESDNPSSRQSSASSSRSNVRVQPSNRTTYPFRAACSWMSKPPGCGAGTRSAAGVAS